jgi:hypothetical protein
MGRLILYISQILEWADHYHKRTGHWPTLHSGPIRSPYELSWRKVDSALRIGLRGLPGNSSLAQLLDEQRGVRNRSRLPRLTARQILAWADAYRGHKGKWPTSESGPIMAAPGETWKAIDHALRLGMRTLPGGSSLARLLEARRGVPNIQTLPRLTVKEILGWADAHHKHWGVWPNNKAGAVRGTPHETWAGVNTAMKMGRRGLPGGSSLARLLAKHRGVRNPKDPPKLKMASIYRWIKAHHRRTGAWPTRKSGSIVEAPGETWAMVDRAMGKGLRGLHGKMSLSRLLRKQFSA